MDNAKRFVDAMCDIKDSSKNTIIMRVKMIVARIETPEIIKLSYSQTIL